MSKTSPFLGAAKTRDEAFPSIASFELTVIQDLYGYYASEPRRREAHYTKDNVPRHHACINPRCQQGGLDLQQIVNFWPSGEMVLHCGGHEGTPKGRRKGAPCDNRFAVTLLKSDNK